MKAERWQQIETVLQQALDRAPVERASFLETACAGDEDLKTEATTLIAAYEEAGDFIEQPAIAKDASVLLGEGGLDGNIGREVGPYEIIERLGAGGMGEVYLAQDTRLRRPVALKLLPTYFASDEARLRRFQSEARAASALNHPNILTIHEVGEHDGVYFIATEFIDGRTIGELMRERELSLEEVLTCVEQVASALMVAHTAGIVHRDIKPENIMRRHDGLIKILDFGIAKLLEPESPEALGQTAGVRTGTEAGLVLGTVSYMSPEQARGLSVDERTDIWSLGVVLYEMVARRLPFSGATRMDTMVAILEREPAPLSQVAAETCLAVPLLSSILSKCLCKEVDGRYRSVSGLLADLKSAREQLKRPASKVESTNERWTMRRQSTVQFVRRYIVLILIAGLFAAAAGREYVLYRRSETQRDGATNGVVQAPARAKLYSDMSDRERLDFVAEQEQRISSMMGDRPVKLSEDAVLSIKKHVDRYVARMNVPSTDQESGNTRAIYERARPYVPVIARSFAARKVPVIIGIYLPVIESAYKRCYESPLGSKGLYQFLPSTAANYGVSRDEMCDVEKAAPAAAHYLADRMAELGEDSQSVTLVLVSYNRGVGWVFESLRQLRSTENYERNFWTLLANREKLDEGFRGETAGYVPSFFAAAIIGENPEVFGLPGPALSTLADAH
jgi:serine/threonine protein kinase